MVAPQRKHVFFFLFFLIITAGVRDLVDKGIKQLTGFDLDNLEVDIVIDAVYNIHVKLPTGSKKDNGKVG